MSVKTNRREFLKVASSAAGIAVIGFNSSACSWVSRGTREPFTAVPELDGELLTAAPHREELGRDLGNMVFTTPSAVLRPASVRDVERMVGFCRRQGIQVAARGQGHSSYGQSQVEAGLVIDMRTLSKVHEVGDGFATVEAGATWRTLLEHTLASRQSPPVLTGFVGLSIGGTLSMGGISGMAYKRGVQVDHVEELTVVTGHGKVEVCSRAQNRELFDAVLAGIGQYAIIVQAKLRLMPVGTRALDWTIRYDDLATFFADLRTLLAREELDMVWGGFKLDPTKGAWFSEIYTTAFYDPPATPDMAHLHRGLHFAPGSEVAIDGTYSEYQTRVDGGVAAMTSMGAWEGFMHPWFDVFLPDRAIEKYVSSVVPKLTLDDVGRFGFVLLFPLKRATAQQPLFRLPEDEWVYLFDILTEANVGPGHEPAFARRMRERNRALYEQAREAGGMRYPIGVLDFEREDWQRHYGAEWKRVSDAKASFDPGRILTPGPGIFRG